MGVEPTICLLAKQMPLPHSSHGPVEKTFYTNWSEWLELHQRIRAYKTRPRTTKGHSDKIGQDLVFQGHLHSPQPDPRMGFLVSSGNHTEG